MTPKVRSRLLDRYRITDGNGFRLRDHDPRRHRPAASRVATRPRRCWPRACSSFRSCRRSFTPHGRWSVLIVLQAMDAAGKDGTIRHVHDRA